MQSSWRDYMYYSVLFPSRRWFRALAPRSHPGATLFDYIHVLFHYFYNYAPNYPLPRVVSTTVQPPAESEQSSE